MTRLFRTHIPGRALVLLSIWTGAALLLLYVPLALWERDGLEPRLGLLFWPAQLVALCLGGMTLRIGWVESRAWRAGSGPEMGGGTFRLLFCLCVSSVVLALGWGQPYHRLVALFHVGLALGLFALAFRMRRSLLRWLPARPLRVADFVLLNLCLLLVATEVGLRGFARWRPSPLFARATADSEDWIRQHRAEPGSIYNGFSYNRDGYYDDEFEPGSAERPVVVVIGDSFGIGIVPHRFHYTSVAERELDGCCLQNRGVASIGPAEYLLMLQAEALEQQPVAIVIGLFVGNDLEDSYRFRPPPSLIRSWFERESVLTYLVARRLLILRDEWRRAGEPAQLSRVGGSPISSRAALIRSSPWLVDPLLEPPQFSEPTYLALELRRARAICSSADRPYRRLFRVLEQIVLAAEDVPLGILLIPDEFQVEDAVWQELVAGGQAEGLERDRPQREIGAWLGERGIPCLDLLPALRATTPLDDGRVHLYHLRDTHLNARGNERVGRLLAEFLAENGWAHLK